MEFIIKTMTLIDEIREYINTRKENPEFNVNDVLVYLDLKQEEYRLKYEERNNKRKDLIPFGKYKDKNISDIAKIDSRYLKWMLKNCKLNDEMKTRIENEINRSQQTQQELRL